MNFRKHIRRFLKSSLSVQPHETLLIVTENSLREIGEQFWSCAQKLTHHTIVTRFRSKDNNSHGLPQSIATSLSYADAIVLLTPQILPETFFKSAQKKGARIMLFYNTAKGLVERCLQTQSAKTSHLSRRLADIFSIGKSIQLLCPNGTDVTFEIARNKGIIADTGCALHAGEMTSIPAGEASVLLGKKSVHGSVVLDRIAGQKNPWDKPIELRIKEGYITQIKGGSDAEVLRKTIRKFGKAGRHVFDLGLGTNDKVKLGASALEDEKAIGTAHIRMGQDRVIGKQGKMIPAIRGMILKPTIRIDGRLIIDDGGILV